jgi:hypothetical protein
MTWNEVSPGVHEAKGALLHMRVEQCDPFDPYRWRVWARAGGYEASEEMPGQLVEVKVRALSIVGRFAQALARDAKAGVLSAKAAPEMAGVSCR